MRNSFIHLCIVLLFAFNGAFGQTEPTKLTGDGLKADVTVRLDDRGIPYIEAKSDADLYFAQGYVTASDQIGRAHV